MLDRYGLTDAATCAVSKTAKCSRTRHRSVRTSSTQVTTAPGPMSGKGCCFRRDPARRSRDVWARCFMTSRPTCRCITTDRIDPQGTVSRSESWWSLPSALPAWTTGTFRVSRPVGVHGRGEAAIPPSAASRATGRAERGEQNLLRPADRVGDFVRVSGSSRRQALACVRALQRACSRHDASVALSRASSVLSGHAELG